MKIKGKIVITDPCYFTDDYEEADKIGLCDSTGVGDWCCDVFKTDASFSEITEVFEGGTKIGEFAADAGLVFVGPLDKVKKLMPDFEQWAKDHPGCATIIDGFDGVVDFYDLEQNEGWLERHVVGIGNFNFYSK